MWAEKFAQVGIRWSAGFPGIVALARPAWYGILFLLALAALGISKLFDPRPKDLARLASELGIVFWPRAPLEQMGLLGTTFEAGSPAKNCVRGMVAGHETTVFDLPLRERRLDGFMANRMPGMITATVVGFRVPAGCYCRSRDILRPESWHVEKNGEWVFVIDLYRAHPVTPRKIASYIEEARSQFQAAIDPKGVNLSC